MMRTAEMKIIRSIHGKTLQDRIRSKDLTQQNEIQEIGRWVRQRRKYWNKYVNRMEDNRLVKIAKTNHPVGKRTQGRPPKRWKEDINDRRHKGTKQALAYLYGLSRSLRYFDDVHNNRCFETLFNI